METLLVGLALGVQFARFYTRRALTLREYTPYTGTPEIIIPFIVSPNYLARPNYLEILAIMKADRQAGWLGRRCAE